LSFRIYDTMRSLPAVQATTEELTAAEVLNDEHFLADEPSPTSTYSAASLGIDVPRI
jgi:hypothetical protein